MARAHYYSGFFRVLGMLAAGAFALAVAACGSAGAEPSATAALQRESGATATKPRGHDPRPRAFHAEGTVNPAFVIPPAVPPLPDGLEFRVRYVYAAGDDGDSLEVMVFVTGVDAPTMLPLPSAAVVSHLRARVEQFRISLEPGPNLLITGTVRSTPVPSPFGAQIGRFIAVTGRFEEGPVTTFSLLAGTVSGSHATTVATATGTITFEWDD